jgi:hypothetical protein
MKAFTPEQKQIDRTLSPALVKGGHDAREILARLLRKHKNDRPTTRFIRNLATFTGWPTK